MAIHVLKTVGAVWNALSSGEKRFEVRKNDRCFQSGDTVILRKLDPDNTAAIRFVNNRREFIELEFKVGWILQGGQFGIEPNYCVFQLEPCEK